MKPDPEVAGAIAYKLSTWSVYLQGGLMPTQVDDSAVGRYVEANGLSIYYEECGAGETLVLLHGGTATCRMWQPHLPFFTERYRVIMPESRGHGHTANPTGQFSYRLMADDMAAFIEALGLHKPLVCGYSDGGQIALELGMRYPELARALVIGATWFKLSESYADWLKEQGFVSPGVVDFERLREAWGEFFEQLQSWHSPHGADYWQTLLVQLSTMWWTPLNYTADEFAGVAAPVLLLTGDGDRVIPLEQTVEMYRLIPNAEVAILPGADHIGALYNVDLFTCIVNDFLARHVADTEPVE